MIGWSGLTSIILRPLMNSKVEVSPRVCALINLKIKDTFLSIILEVKIKHPITCFKTLVTVPYWQTSQTCRTQGHMEKSSNGLRFVLQQLCHQVVASSSHKEGHTLADFPSLQPHLCHLQCKKVICLTQHLKQYKCQVTI